MRQRADMAELAKLVAPSSGIRKKRVPKWHTGQEPLRSVFEQVIVALTGLVGNTSYFRLTKLLYLVDLTLMRQRGWGATGQIYVRAQEGPWPPELPKAIQRLDGREVTLLSRGKRPQVATGPAPRFFPELDGQVLEAIADVVARYGSKTEAQLKTSVYLTDAMKAILVRERRGEDLRNSVVLDARADH